MFILTYFLFTSYKKVLKSLTVSSKTRKNDFWGLKKLYWITLELIYTNKPGSV